jgi:hypothetical protein
MLRARLGSQSSVISINTGSNFFTGNVILNTSWASNGNTAGPISVPFYNGNTAYLQVYGNGAIPAYTGLLLKTDANITNFNAGNLYTYSYSNSSGNAGIHNNITFDSTGNAYSFFGQSTVASGIAKLDSSLNLISLTQLATTSIPTYTVSNPNSKSQINTDSSDNVYITGEIGSSTNRVMYNIKIDNSGNIQYFNNIDTGSGAGDLDFEMNTFLTSTHLYIIAQTNDSPTPGTLLKFDTSGNFVWGRKLYVSSGTGLTRYNSLTVFNNEIYIVGSSKIDGVNNTGIIVKYDIGGNLLWQKIYGSVMDSFQMIKIYSNEIYVLGNYYSSSKFYITVMKIDIDGNIIYSRLLNASTLTSGISLSLSDVKNGFIINNNKLNFIGINTTSPIKYFLFVLPTDGSIPGSGTYLNSGVTFTYTNVTLTASTSNLTSASRSVTVTSPTYTSTNIISRITGTISIPASTYTFNKTYI